MQMEESLKGWAQAGAMNKGRVKVRPIRSFHPASVVIRVTLISLAAVTVYAFFVFDYKGINFFEAVANTIETFRIMFLQPALKHFTFMEAVQKIGITLSLAFLTTLIAAVAAVFLGLLAAQNLSSRAVSTLIRSGVAYIRSVDTVLWVLIFAVAAGLGSVAAVIGMTFHSVSYLVKAYSESFEELDKGVIEALKASGANWWQIVFQAVIPSSMTYLLSWTFLRFEINFGVAVAMGAAAGAGGIGFEMFMASSFYYDLREMGVITYLILAVALVLEACSTAMKGQLQTKH